jgi:hypothetical protein
LILATQSALSQPLCYRSESYMTEDVIRDDDGAIKKSQMIGVTKKINIFNLHRETISWLTVDKKTNETTTMIFYIQQIDNSNPKLDSYMVKDKDDTKYVINIAKDGRGMIVLSSTDNVLTFFIEGPQ